MPLTFRRSWQILPGVRFNLNRHSFSWTFGFHGGPHHTRSSTGRRTTSQNLRGGFVWRRTSTDRSRSRRRQS
jgi:hypothetical protein